MVKVKDRFTARWRARQDRKLIAQTLSPKEKVRTKLARWLKPKDQVTEAPRVFTREDRRRALRAAGPQARAIRLHTHMRRPLVAVNCAVRRDLNRRTHSPDRRAINAFARREYRRLEKEEAA